MNKILVIQTAFIGDAILATSVVESLHRQFPSAKIDLLVNGGNEVLFEDHPFLNGVLSFHKKQGKVAELIRLIGLVRKAKYDAVFNLHRFFSSGLIAVLSGAKNIVGFNKNPFSFLYSEKVKHEFGQLHEVERNHRLIMRWCGSNALKPALYPPSGCVDEYQPKGLYSCIAPASVWFTKQLPQEKWEELINMLPVDTTVCLLGGSADKALCDSIAAKFPQRPIANFAGKLSLLQSALLMQGAQMNYVNDSAPMHLASAVNAPVTAFYCSTIPEFGFGPLSDLARVAQVGEKLACRPCGIHGQASCPKGHFKCSKIELPVYAKE